ncbi:hypothetical protein HDV00_011887 [Rhizophlyctis rosea]|nr:hypothetical protein HDV00_011887 [Rhizophlyctis rosea]
MPLQALRLEAYRNMKTMFLRLLEESELTVTVQKFFIHLDRELSKADKFFKTKIGECTDRLKDFRAQIALAEQHEEQEQPRQTGSREGSESDLLPNPNALKRFASTAVRLVRKQNRSKGGADEELPEGGDGNNSDSSPDSSGLENVVAVSKRPRERLRKAILEYYRLLEKFEKGVNIKGAGIFEPRASQSAIFDEDRGKKQINDLLHETEELYATKFESGNRFAKLSFGRVGRGLTCFAFKTHGHAPATNSRYITTGELKQGLRNLIRI